MDAKITSQTETQAIFTVAMTEDGLAPIKREVFDNLRRRVKAAGFRPGKAPDMIVERELGSTTVQSEVVDHALQHAYADAVKELGLQAVGQPQVSLEKFVPYSQLEFKVTVDLLPKVKLADYKKVRVKRPKIEVDPTEIDKTVEDLRRREAVRLDSEHPAKIGDEVNFDFDGSKDGEPVSGASAKGQTLRLGSGNFIPGFEEQLVGLSKGEEKTFDIRFPAAYQEPSLADKVVTFAVKINTVTDLVLPALDDEFVAKVSPFANSKELRQDISDRIEAEKQEQANREYEQAVLDKVLAESTYKVPDSLLNEQLTRMRAELEQNLGYSGLNIEKYLELTKKTPADMDKEMKPEATKRVGLAMLLTEVAKAEKLSVTKDDLDGEIERLRAEYPDPKTQAELDNPQTREELYNHLMSSKVIAKLVEYAGA